MIEYAAGPSGTGNAQRTPSIGGGQFPLCPVERVRLT